METEIIIWFEKLGSLAILISLILSVIIGILGVIPSFFITVANITFFGLINGLILSILGEALGAIVSFYLYRKGIKKLDKTLNKEIKYIKSLKDVSGVRAFILILGLRILPFAPSMVVTLAGARSKMGIVNFSISSTIGKIPALILEAYSIQQVLKWSLEGKIILSVISIFIIGFIFYKGKQKER